MLVDILRRVGEDYPKARGEEFTGHPLAELLRTEAPSAVYAACRSQFHGLTVKGSAGAGNFATVPWVALFDPLVTSNAQSGYYIVFLFSTEGELFLSLNQGTTAVRREFGPQTRDVLSDRAAIMRARLVDFRHALPVAEIDLGTAQQLPRDYEHGHAIGTRYEIDSLPSEDNLVHDLNTSLAAYRALTFRGGLEPSPEASVDESLLGEIPRSLEEIRRYRMHRRIERNAKASAMAKLVHGLTCQICEFNFENVYGEIGGGFIEAHHLRPLSTLSEGVAVRLDVDDDFCVLCSNCHRMIHRTQDPSDLNYLRALLRRSSK